MNYKRKLRYAGLSLVGLTVIFVLVKFLLDQPYRNSIPAVPDLHSLSAQLQEQISTASRKAHLNPNSDHLGGLGIVYHSCANYDKAAQCYELAIKRDKSTWLWRYYLGYLNKEMGESDKAIQNFYAALKHNPKAFHAWFYIGESYMKQGINDKAEMAFNKIAQLPGSKVFVKTARVNYFPLQVDARFQLARIYMGTDRVDEAEKILMQIVSVFHTYSPVYRLLGNAYNVKGDSVTGRKYIIRAKDQADYTPLLDTLVDKIALVSRSELYLPKQIDEAINSANPEMAEKLLNNGLKYIPDNKYLISKAVSFYLRMDAGAKALPYLPRHLNYFKDDVNEMNLISDLLFKKGFYSQAITYFNRIMVLKPEETSIKSRNALCYWHTGKKDQAVEQVSELVLHNPTDANVIGEAAEFMLQIGESAKAKSYLAELHRLAPDNQQVFKLSGRLAEKEGNTNSAITDYEQAFRFNPHDLSVIQPLCNLLLAEKKWQESILILRKSLDFHPNEPFLLERLGALLVSCPDPKQRNATEGEEYCERAFYNIASAPEILISAGRNLVQAFAVLENFEAARFYLNLTISMAKSQKLPAEYIQGLINLGLKIQKFAH
jgi:tetratricopeptide (TPR) repeat protein